METKGIPNNHYVTVVCQGPEKGSNLLVTTYLPSPQPSEHPTWSPDDCMSLLHHPLWLYGTYDPLRLLCCSPMLTHLLQQQ